MLHLQVFSSHTIWHIACRGVPAAAEAIYYMMVGAGPQSLQPAAAAGVSFLWK